MKSFIIDLNMTLRGWFFSGLVFAGLPLLGWAGAPAAKSVTWSPHADQDSCYMNMGPTGVRVWMRGPLFQVMAVDNGSPADRILVPGDQVVGAGGTAFSATTDSRMTLGDAIGRAEATDGKLNLAITREDRKQKVTITLPVTGPFSPTWPYDCAKSQRILDEACLYLRDIQMPNGMVVTDGSTGTFLAGLLLLGSGEARFRDSARRAAYATDTMGLEKGDLINWAFGYGGLLLAEYYLATGDETVLPRLKDTADRLARGQMQCGAWGHKSPSGGYGALNQAGVVCALTLVLAKECGVEVDPAALQRAVTFFARYTELGAVPYGDHFPYGVPDVNGRSATAGIMCSFLPDLQHEAAVTAQSVAMSYWQREEGHTGGFFSMMWGPLACDMAGPDAFRTFMDYQTWYYNLCRTWKGSLVHLPFHEALTRFDSATYTEMDGPFTTAGLALTFALPHRQLRILGAPRSVFAAKLEGPMLALRQHYQARKWSAFDAALEPLRKAPLAMEEKRWLAQLEAAAKLVREDVQCTVREIKSNLNDGDPYRAKQQYLALKRFLGDQNETSLALGKLMVDEPAGDQYYKAWQDLTGVRVMSWVSYGEAAKKRLESIPSLRLPVWESLALITNTPAQWQKAGAAGVTDRREFTLASTDFASLRVQLQSPRQSQNRVQLNGAEVLRTVRGQRSGYAKIELDKSALALLKVGTNTLSIVGTSEGKGGNALGVGLDGMRVERPLARTPARGQERQGEALVPAILQETLDKARENYRTMVLEDATNSLAIPERLCVRDSEDRFQMALNAACDALPPEQLQAALRSPLPYWRGLASQSLARRGEAGLNVAKACLKDVDWRVRSAGCEVYIAKCPPKRNQEKPVAEIAVDQETLAGLTALLKDQNAWVRSRAAAALGALKKPDQGTATALAAAVADPDAWVRASAVEAINRVTDDRQLLVKAAADAMSQPDTTFGVVGRAINLILTNGPNDTVVIPSLVYALEHPGEGGGEPLNPIMTHLANLDAAGTVAVPTLAKVAAGGYAYDRLKGNPRKTAIELLGNMGVRAAAAEPVLKTLAKGTNEAERVYQKAAEAALLKIGKTD